MDRPPFRTSVAERAPFRLKGHKRLSGGLLVKSGAPNSSGNPFPATAHKLRGRFLLDHAEPRPLQHCKHQWTKGVVRVETAAAKVVHALERQGLCGQVWHTAGDASIRASHPKEG